MKMTMKRDLYEIPVSLTYEAKRVTASRRRVVALVEVRPVYCEEGLLFERLCKDGDEADAFRARIYNQWLGIPGHRREGSIHVLTLEVGVNVGDTWAKHQDGPVWFVRNRNGGILAWDDMCDVDGPALDAALKRKAAWTRRANPVVDEIEFGWVS